MVPVVPLIVTVEPLLYQSDNHRYCGDTRVPVLPRGTLVTKLWSSEAMLRFCEYAMVLKMGDTTDTNVDHML